MKSEVYVPAKSIFENKGIIWMYQEQYNYLMHYDVEKGELSLDINLTQEVGPATYIKVLGNEECLYLIPERGKFIVVFDFLSKQINTIEIPDIAVANNEIVFCGAYILGEELVCIPAESSNIVVVDIPKKKVKNVIDIRKILADHIVTERFESTAIYKEKIVGVLSDANKFFAYTPQTADVTVYEVEEGKKLTGIASNGSKLYLYENSTDKLYEYDVENKKIVDSVEMPLGFKYKIYSFGENILVDAYNGGRLMIFDGLNRKIYEKNIDSRFSYRMDEQCIGAMDEKGRYYYDSVDNKLYEYDGHAMKILNCLSVSKCDDLVLNRQIFDMYVLKENESVTLDAFIDSIK